MILKWYTPHGLLLDWRMYSEHGQWRTVERAACRKSIWGFASIEFPRGEMSWYKCGRLLRFKNEKEI